MHSGSRRSTHSLGGFIVVEGGCIVGLLDPYMSYRILSYAHARVRVRFIVVEEGSTVVNGGITVVEGGSTVVNGGLPIL